MLHYIVLALACVSCVSWWSAVRQPYTPAPDFLSRIPSVLSAICQLYTAGRLVGARPCVSGSRFQHTPGDLVVVGGSELLLSFHSQPSSAILWVCQQVSAIPHHRDQVWCRPYAGVSHTTPQRPGVVLPISWCKYTPGPGDPMCPLTLMCQSSAIVHWVWQYYYPLPLGTRTPYHTYLVYLDTWASSPAPSTPPPP